MMKTFVSFCILLFAGIGFHASAQVSNVQVVDCQNDSSSIYQALSTGKPLLVASKGTDCSACRNRAGGLQQWAAQNTAKVTVWGAMTRIYSSVNPDCQAVSQWIVQYSWSAIFTFIDVQRHWLDQGTPRYYVYDPRDSSLAYNGFSETDARNKALEISDQMLSVEVHKNPLRDIALVHHKKSWKLINLPQENLVIEIVDLHGRRVEKNATDGLSGIYEYNYEGFDPGLYFLRLRNNKGFTAVIRALVY